MASYIVSARKYRPSRFDEVIGQEQVSSTLKQALKKDRLAQAFLFCGPHGVGKTTCARILAKALNCTALTDDYEPCGACSNCQAAENNKSFNILELDAASNNSVDHIRQLTEQVRFAPQSGKYKVFIIDEVHMLSSSAFNAFLKTLEEPPPYAVFILATTEKHKILPTILSRCQIFEFNRISTVDIVAQLRSIADQESISADDGALHLIAKKANGAMRDALSLYDKIVSSIQGETLSRSSVIENLSLLDDQYYFEMVDLLMIEDLSSVMVQLDQVMRQGFHPEIFVDGMSNHFRNLLMASQPGTSALLDAPETTQTQYAKQANAADRGFILSGLHLLNECNLKLPIANNKRLQVELCLAKICYLLRRISADPFLTHDDESKKKLAANPTPEATTAASEIDVSSSPTISEKNTADAASRDVTDKAPDDSSEAGLESTEYSTLTLNPSESSSEASQIGDNPAMPVLAREFSPRAKSKRKLFSLKSVDKMQEEVKADLQKIRVHKDIDLDQLKQIWESYAEENVTMPGVQTTFKTADLSLDGTVLTVTVASNIAKYQLIDEKNLMDYLMRSAENYLLTMEVVVDESLQEEILVERPPTDKEIYERMASENPNVTKFVDQMALLPDRDKS